MLGESCDLGSTLKRGQKQNKAFNSPAPRTGSLVQMPAIPRFSILQQRTCPQKSQESPKSEIRGAPGGLGCPARPPPQYYDFTSGETGTSGTVATATASVWGSRDKVCIPKRDPTLEKPRNSGSSSQNPGLTAGLPGREVHLVSSFKTASSKSGPRALSPCCSHRSSHP